MLRLDGVDYRYPGSARDSLVAVSLELREGEVTGLVGGSESGRTTLCLVLAGLAPRVVGGRLRGSLLVDGQDANAWPMHRLAEVVVLGLQEPEGQLSLTAESVYEEVALGPMNLGLARDEVVARVEESLAQLGIGELAGRDPRHLSSGQVQLVAIAGLVAMRPRFLVLDEPLARLDARSSQRVLDALGALAAAGAGILLAEGRGAPLADACETVVAMDHGRVVARGPARAVLGDRLLQRLGVEEPAGARLERLLRAEGIEPLDLEPWHDRARTLA